MIPNLLASTVHLVASWGGGGRPARMPLLVNKNPICNVGTVSMINPLEGIMDCCARLRGAGVSKALEAAR